MFHFIHVAQTKQKKKNNCLVPINEGMRKNYLIFSSNRKKKFLVSVNKTRVLTFFFWRKPGLPKLWWLQKLIRLHIIKKLGYIHKNQKEIEATELQKKISFLNCSDYSTKPSSPNLNAIGTPGFKTTFRFC